MVDHPPEKDIADQTTQVEAPSVNAERAAAAAAPSGPRARRSAQRSSMAERMERIKEEQRKRSRKGFLAGLVVGQLAVVGLSYGGSGFQALFVDHLNLQSPMPIRSMVFCSMTAGIGLTGILILLVLALQGIGWFFTKKTIGFGVALWRGMKRVCHAGWSLFLTLMVIGGTAWLVIPPEEWQSTAKYLEAKGLEGYEVVRPWIDKVRSEAEELIPEDPEVPEVPDDSETSGEEPPE